MFEEKYELKALGYDFNRVIFRVVPMAYPLPGRRSRYRIIMFHEMEEGLPAPGEARQSGDYTLPTNLIAENHLLEIWD